LRINCEKGFYKFYPQNIAEVARFQVKYGKDLVQVDDYFTFAALASLPNFSFIAHPYGSLVGLANYAGERAKVMAQNGYAFYQKTQTLILKTAIFEKANYFQSNYIFSDTLPQAYSYDSKGIITGFVGFVDVDIMKFKIERFFYEGI